MAVKMFIGRTIQEGLAVADAEVRRYAAVPTYPIYRQTSRRVSLSASWRPPNWHGLRALRQRPQAVFADCPRERCWDAACASKCARGLVPHARSRTGSWGMPAWEHFAARRKRLPATSRKSPTYFCMFRGPCGLLSLRAHARYCIRTDLSPNDGLKPAWVSIFLF